MTDKTSSYARKLRDTCEQIRKNNCVSVVCRRIDCARTTIYRAIKNPEAVSVGLAERIISAAEAELSSNSAV